jgi:hypothetical protein
MLLKTTMLRSTKKSVRRFLKPGKTDIVMDDFTIASTTSLYLRMMTIKHDRNVV